MASCAAGKTFRVYGQYTSLVCKLMIKTWGYLFEANKREEHKNTCEPSKKSYSLSSGLCYIPLRMYAFCTLFNLSYPILLGFPMWLNEHSISMESNIVERVAPVSARWREAGYGLADRLCGHRLHRDHGWG